MYSFSSLSISLSLSFCSSEVLVPPRQLVGRLLLLWWEHVKVAVVQWAFHLQEEGPEVKGHQGQSR